MSSDDDIEIIEDNTVALAQSKSGNNDICQLCDLKLDGLTESKRQNHYRQHCSSTAHTYRGTRTAKRGRSRPASVGTSQRKTTPMKLKTKAESAVQEDIFWYPVQAKAPPENFTPGVLSILKEALKQSHRKGATQRAVLCYERTPHIFRETFDTSWGCGYRNFLILCAALMDQQSQPIYFPHLDAPIPPGVRNLQRWLENAWTRGYDENGAEHFEHKLVDTNKKIGTGDLYVAFTSRKIPCMLVDFDNPKGFVRLTEWVVNYFDEKPEGDINQVLRTASPVVATKKMPIIMQYDGHSVTIVGYELTKNGKHNLLVFNPSNKVDHNIRQAALNVSTSVGWASPSSVSLGKGKRRERSKSPAPKKRPRTNQDPDSDEDSVDNARRAVALKPTLDPDAVMKAFRFKAPRNKDEYQLLYFTMDAPLTDEQQNDCKMVLSTEC